MLQGFCSFSYCGPPIWTYFPLISGTAQLFSLWKQSWKLVSKTSIQFPHVASPPPPPPPPPILHACVWLFRAHTHLPPCKEPDLTESTKNWASSTRQGPVSLPHWNHNTPTPYFKTSHCPATLKPQHTHTILQNKSLSCHTETTTHPHHTSKQGHYIAALKPEHINNMLQNKFIVLLHWNYNTQTLYFKTRSLSCCTETTTHPHHT